MTAFSSTHLTPGNNFPYHMITPTYTPDTTIAICLRQFEKESKSQAEDEYDAEHGCLPNLPEEDEVSLHVDKTERNIQKKKRKVRSAIVSRRKSAIYEKKLEEELRCRDDINSELKARLGCYNEVLRDVRAKIEALHRHLEANSAPKRARTVVHQPQRPASSVIFPSHDNPIDDILSISAEETRQRQSQVPTPVSFNPTAPNGKLLSYSNHSDFTSECSDRQISPVLQPQSREPPRDLPLFSDDNSWKFGARLLSNFAPHLTAPPYAM